MDPLYFLLGAALVVALILAVLFLEVFLEGICEAIFEVVSYAVGTVTRKLFGIPPSESGYPELFLGLAIILAVVVGLVSWRT
jgi:hypothetical protein